MAAITTEQTPLQAAFEKNPYETRINQLSAALKNPAPDAKNPGLQDEMGKAVTLFKRFLQTNIDLLNKIWPVQKQAIDLTNDAVKLAAELNTAKEKGEAQDPSKQATLLKLQEQLSKMGAENQAINQRIKEIETGCGKIQGFIVMLMQKDPTPEELKEFQSWSSVNTLLWKNP